MSVDLTKQLLEYISKQFRIGIEEIDTSQSLVDQGVIDSFGFVEIAAFLEKACSVKINDDAITPANFGSVEKIVIFADSLPKV